VSAVAAIHQLLDKPRHGLADLDFGLPCDWLLGACDRDAAWVAYPVRCCPAKEPYLLLCTEHKEWFEACEDALECSLCHTRYKPGSACIERYEPL
jgi:hypothetical protein